MFISPGISHCPFIGMILAPGGMGVELAAPTPEMRSPAITTVAFSSAGPPSIPTTVPPTKAMIAGRAGGARCRQQQEFLRHGAGLAPIGGHYVAKFSFCRSYFMMRP